MITQVVSFYNSPCGKSLFNGVGALGGITQLDISSFDLSSEDAILKQLHLKLDERQVQVFVDFTDYGSSLPDGDLAEFRRWNVLVPKVISSYASIRDIRVIRFSTYAVFGGNGGEDPYVEDVKPEPVGLYGKTMLEGEGEVLQANRNAMVFRLPWVYSSFYRSNFVSMMIEAMFSHPELYVFDDQFGNLCNLFDLQKMLQYVIGCLVGGEFIIPTDSDLSARIYHLSPEGFSSRYEIAGEILHTFSRLFRRHLKTKLILPISSRDADMQQLNCCLDSTKFFKAFGKSLPDWHFSLYNATQKIVKSIGDISS